MQAKIYVTLKYGVLDPQGLAIKKSIESLNISGIDEVKQGKYFEITLDSKDRSEAEKLLDKICQEMLANTVIEDYRFELI